MAMEGPKGAGPSRMLLLLVVLAVVLVLVYWLMAERDDAEEPEMVPQVEATDLGGGELIAREPQEGEVPVDVPDVEMTNVPPEERPSPSPDE